MPNTICASLTAAQEFCWSLLVGCDVQIICTDHLDRPLPAHRRGTDVAQALARTHCSVPRWWACKGLAAKPQVCRPAKWHHAAHGFQPIPDFPFPSCTLARAMADRIGP
ncbi:hypothetical protein FLG15_11920 [Xanthomonas phaseoli pv. dieffenbachiae]